MQVAVDGAELPPIVRSPLAPVTAAARVVRQAAGTPRAAAGPFAGLAAIAPLAAARSPQASLAVAPEPAGVMPSSPSAVKAPVSTIVDCERRARGFAPIAVIVTPAPMLIELNVSTEIVGL